MGSYRHCDVCSCKTFFDEGLDYIHPEETWDEEKQEIVIIDEDFQPTVYNGKVSELMVSGVGSWTVLCPDCSKDYEIVLKKKP